MKIYRAVLRGYYGVDSRFGGKSWNRTIDVESVWYSDRAIAEQHFEEFNELRDNVLDKFADFTEEYSDSFDGYVSMPRIEEQEIHETFVQRLSND